MAYVLRWFGRKIAVEAVTKNRKVNRKSGFKVINWVRNESLEVELLKHGNPMFDSNWSIVKDQRGMTSEMDWKLVWKLVLWAIFCFLHANFC